LHLLLDVRLPAHRRSRLGGGRSARAGLSARRYCWPHHAQRRGPAARGWPLAAVLLGDTQLRVLRPDLRLRGGGDHSGWPAPHGDESGGCLLLPHPDERELRAPADAARRGAGHPQRRLSAARVESEAQAPRAAHGIGDDPARSGGGGAAPRVRLGRGRRCVERHELHRATPQRPRRGSLEHAASRGEAARAVHHRMPAAAPGRSRQRMNQVLVPDMGDFKEVEVIEVLVKPGDAVTKEQSLITLESDKATMEIPSPAAGVVKELKVKTGDKVSQGSPILLLDAQDEAKKATPKAEPPKKEEAPR